MIVASDDIDDDIASFVAQRGRRDGKDSTNYENAEYENSFSFETTATISMTFYCVSLCTHDFDRICI